MKLDIAILTVQEYVLVGVDLISNIFIWMLGIVFMPIWFPFALLGWVAKKMKYVERFE